MQNYKNLAGWLFTFNEYTNSWRAAKREYANDLFSSFNSENVLKATDINILIELIIKTDGDKSRITQLLKQS